MKQLTQKLRDGTMSVEDVAVPLPARGQVIVRNHYSLISAGTEGGTVKAARKSLLGKAKERPKQVRQVLDTLVQQGPVQTYRAVAKKLDAFSPLGYSSAGEVIGVGDGVTRFNVGDLAACSGAGYANHAEVIAVPENLCVKLEPGTKLEHAAYQTLGAIAMQGVRQADVRLGECCVVIGLGLLGQLTCMILRSAGVRVVGIDINEAAVEVARRNGTDAVFITGSTEIQGAVIGITGGIGADAAIITASANTSEPVNTAGSLLRKRGVVVIVGAVPTGFDREPHFYKKELTLRMSCSYGPGRYDPSYEEGGHDYPAGYVRWTENRNMQAFQELVSNGAVNVEQLTTHEFDLEDVQRAYDLIVNRSEPFLGILIRYDTSSDLGTTTVRSLVDPASWAPENVGVSFIGAGSYAISHLLPNVASRGDITLRSVMTMTGTSSRSVSDKFGFAAATTDVGEVMDDKDTNVVFIATRHDSHGDYVLRSLAAGKHVFVEKPLCIDSAELDQIEEILRNSVNGQRLMVGFNRRFAPLVADMKLRLGDRPAAMIYRVNAGEIPSDSWIQDPQAGGGRIIGEVCHFIDLFVYLAGSRPQAVHTTVMPDPYHHNDTVSISLAFQNGSIGTVHYFANGGKGLAKEYLEVHQSSQTFIIRDFKEMETISGGKSSRRRLLNQDKGQRAMVAAFLDAIRQGSSTPIPEDESVETTRTTFQALESLRQGAVCRFD